MSRPEYSVRLLRIAEDDLTEIVTYIAADRPLAAEALAAKIEKNLALLSKHPYMGRIPKEEDLASLGYRYPRRRSLPSVLHRRGVNGPRPSHLTRRP